MRYILTVIDVFSKYAWVTSTKSMDAATFIAAIRAVLSDAEPRRPFRLTLAREKSLLTRALLRSLEVITYNTSPMRVTRKPPWPRAQPHDKAAPIGIHEQIIHGAVNQCNTGYRTSVQLLALLKYRHGPCGSKEVR